MLDPNIVFLNHGSFGACPRPVFEIYQAWQRKLEATRCHVSQFGQREAALQWLEDWNHETGKCCGLDYAEAFHPMSVW